MNNLEINGNSYGPEDMAGKGYVRTFPNIAQDMYNSFFLTQTAICRQTFTVSLGVFTFKVEPNKNLYEDMKFVAVLELPEGSDVGSVLANPPVFCGRIQSYDKGTGSLKVRIEHVYEHGTYSTMFFVANVVSTAPITNTIANGLTTGSSPTTTHLAMRRGNMGVSHLRNGFGVMTGATLPPPYYASLSGTGVIDTYYKEVYASAVVMASAITLTPETSRSAVYLGRKPWIKYRAQLWGFFKFRSPSTLANVTNNYKVSVGFRGYGSTEALPFGHSGMGVTYNYAENGGSWISRSGNNGSVVTNNSATAFVVSTEYQIEVRIIAGSANFVVNGTSIATLTAPSSTSLNNFMHPFIMIERIAGISPSMFAEEINVGGF